MFRTVFCFWYHFGTRRSYLWSLTHWGQVMHICVGIPAIIGSENGLSVPSHYLNQCWHIVNWTLTNKLLVKIQTFPFKKIHLKMSFGKLQPFFLGLNVLMVSALPVGNHTLSQYQWNNLEEFAKMHHMNPQELVTYNQKHNKSWWKHVHI